jgi:hypothetical protein
MKTIIYNIKHFFSQIQKLIYWFPVIWKDQDWDQYYFMILLRHKLVTMRKFFASDHAQTEDAKDHAVVIDDIIELIEKINNQDYHNHDLFKLEFPNYVERDLLDCFIESPDHPGWMQFESGMTQEQGKFFSQCSMMDYEEEKADYDRIFDLLKDNIQYFWD